MKTRLLKPIAFLFLLFIVKTGYGQNGTHSVSVATLSGEVVDVTVPDDIRPGDQVSGSVVSETASAQLNGAVVDVQNKKTDLSKKIFSFLVPAGGITSLSFAILNKSGNNICKKDLAIRSQVPETNFFSSLPGTGNPSPTPAPNGLFTVPSFGIAGSPLNIRGAFDGDASNTQVTINKTPCDVIAESPRFLSVTIPPGTNIGPATLHIVENGISRSYPIQVASINLTSDKPVISKGQNAQVNVTITGMSRLALDGRGYTMTLNNLSPDVISFSGSNSITKELNSSSVIGDTYNFSTEIKGLTSGKYSITASVNSDWDNYRTNTAIQYQEALDAGVNPQMAQEYYDFVLAAYHPGTGAGSCRIGPAKSGGTLSCTNINCTDVCIVFSIPKSGGTNQDPREEGPSATPAPGRIYFCSCSKWQWW